MKTLHEKTQERILEACKAIGLQAEMEYRGKGWRADVFASNGNSKYAFEVQLSPQTLKRTQERQEKYIRDGIVGCWLFENEPARQRHELEGLPIFKLEDRVDDIFVSLKGRKRLHIDTFIKDFVGGRIKFCKTLNALPQITIVFLEHRCWKCGAINHIFYLAPFHSACNTEITHNESMWTSNKYSFRPEILKMVKEYATTDMGRHLNLAIVKERYSKTMGKSYMSFGCNQCDSIFGDFYIKECIFDAYEGLGIVDEHTFNVDFELDLRQNIPHWCHPGEHPFCE